MGDKIIQSGGTRRNWLLSLTVIATIAWVFTMLGLLKLDAGVSFSAWASFEQWLFTAYGASEVGAKYSQATALR